MNATTILTNAEIEAILDDEFTTVTPECEYTPSFMDSIQDLEDEMDTLECIIDFPFPSFEEEEELLLA